MSNLTLTPEQLDAMLQDPATRKVLEANTATKDLVLDWNAMREARVAQAIEEAKTKVFTLAGQPATLVQVALFLRANSYYIRNTKSRETMAKGILDIIDDAVAQLGVLMPADKLWKGLSALAGVKETA